MVSTVGLILIVQAIGLLWHSVNPPTFPHFLPQSTVRIAEVNIPTGAPKQYRFDDHLNVLSADYLGDADAVAAAAAAVAAQAGTT